jgi:hypothetical protein
LRSWLARDFGASLPKAESGHVL